MFDWVSSKDLSEEGALSSIIKFRYLKTREKLDTINLIL